MLFEMLDFNFKVHPACLKIVLMCLNTGGFFSLALISFITFFISLLPLLRSSVAGSYPVCHDCICV
jgi:hypothetical protein